MPSNNFHIRLATADDVPSILAFIKGLAEFEYLSNEVIVTEKDLRKSLFGTDHDAGASVDLRSVSKFPPIEA